jgi:hypothetical protein
MSLISNESVEEVVDDNPGSQESSEPNWWWDKSNPGVGDRPDWLPEKYKSAEDTAKAFKELEKRLGSAPDKYDWSKGESWIDADYEPFQKMAAFAKSQHVPQSVMDSMLESVGTFLNEFNTDYAAEKQALGDDAENRLNTIDNWAKANFSEETHKALIGNMRTAGDVKAIEEMRSKMIEGMTTIPTGNETAPTVMTVKEIQAEMLKNYDRYKTDEGYRAEIKTKIARAIET